MVLALDLDGTLIDARPRQVEVAHHAVKELGALALNERLFWECKRAGASTEQALVQLGYPLGFAADVARLWKRDIESKRWLAHDRPLPGVAIVLRRLRAQRITVLVLTARQRSESARRSIEIAGLARLVDELLVVDPAKAASSKAKLLMDRDALAFIGDTASDGMAAAAAGVRFVAVTTGQRAHGYLHSLGYRVSPTLRDAVRCALAGSLLAAAF
jgi:phosphoglycolate phosphatase-like HAD superfamily hydrolase